MQMQDQVGVVQIIIFQVQLSAMPAAVVVVQVTQQELRPFLKMVVVMVGHLQIIVG